MCLAVFTVGIAIGSGLAARASHGQPNLGLVPLGALLMGLFALAIAWIASVLVAGPTPIGPAAVLASRHWARAARRLLRPGRRRRPLHRARRSPPCSRGRRSTGARASSPRSTSSTPPTWWAPAASSPRCRRPASAWPLCSLRSACSASPSLRYVVRAWGSEVMRDAGRTVFQVFF